LLTGNGPVSNILSSKGKVMQERIDGFVAAADSVTADYWKAQGFTYAPAPTHKAEMTSDKWCKVVTLEERNGVKTVTSVYAFIALQSFSTKALGQVVQGQIFKPATFKAPAKHARGSVYEGDFGRSCLTSHGPVYLK